MFQQTIARTLPSSNRVSRAIAILLAIVALPATSHGEPASVYPDDIRVLSAVGKFGDTQQVAAAFRLRAPRPLRAHHLELAVGSFFTSNDNRPFLSLGPVWRFPFAGSARSYLDFGFSPTVLAGSRLDGRELGGSFHFTSSLAIGMRFGRAEKYSLALRAQHTSNGGLHTENPGLDTVGLNFSINFRD